MSLKVSESFSFPFPPYETQTQFMTTLFHALEEKKLGIFESPTGTGKSLSLICGSLSWLNSHSSSHKEQLKSIVEEKIEEEDEVDWFNSTTKKIQKEIERKKAKTELDKIEKDEKRINDLRSKYDKMKLKYTAIKKVEKDIESNSADLKKSLLAYKDENDDSELEDQYILGEYNSENESLSESDSDEEEEGCLKIFYCSRTHSQLSQFVREIQKTEFKENIRVAALGSRKNLCVNEAVNQLSSLAMINERCLDMQNKKKGVVTSKDNDKTLKKQKTSSGCPFNKQKNVQNLSDKILIDVQDIEQLVTTSKKIEACPYYATRKSIKDSQLVVLPYNCLLHRSTRAASHIKLRGNVVIIDEVHNLLETIGNIHSAVLGYNQLCDSCNQLSEYLRRFQKRLSPKNLLYIKQILFVINAYIRLLSNDVQFKKKCSDLNTHSQVLSLQEFLHQTLTDNLNIFKLIQYIENSKIAQKLHGYKKVFNGEVKLKTKAPENVNNTNMFLVNMQKNENQLSENASDPKTNSDLKANSTIDERECGSPLLGLTEFLKALKGGDGNGEGRIVVHCSKDASGGKGFIKYLLLNPASQFHDIVRECRAVILAGGTMSPVDEFKQQLFLSAGASADRIVEFSCGHVVPEENVLPLVLTKGPCSVPLDFTYSNRKEPRVLDELGRTLCNICRIIPGGIVIFFPSYDYEEYVSVYFRKEKIMDNISSKKIVFREPKKSSEMDKVLYEYSKAAKRNIDGKKGAVLFSVVGGKMSEGINFSDELGRCVVMVGLPFPNSTSPELKEKMDYLNKHFVPNAEGKTAGASYYENLCFKAVNQSVGRSIRHKNDYGSILLLDQRYALESSRANLSLWIRTKVRVCESFGQSVSLISKVSTFLIELYFYYKLLRRTYYNDFCKQD